MDIYLRPKRRSFPTTRSPGRRHTYTGLMRGHKAYSLHDITRGSTRGGRVRAIRIRTSTSHITVPETTPSVAYHLPAELVSMIFGEAIRLMGLPLFAPGCYQHSPGWFTLLWICARWRNILIADAAVWATCYSHYPKLQDIFLARAHLVPLVYKLTATEPRISPISAMFRSDQSELTRFFAATPLDQCKEIYVSDGRGPGITSYIFDLASASTEQPLKSLRSLHLEAWHWQWNGLTADLLTKGHGAFAITADSLEDVHFQNCWTVISSPVLKRLSVIFNSSHLTRPSIHVFYHAMAVLSGGALTHLELVNPVGHSYRADMRQYQAYPVILPALTSLRLTGYAPHIANVLRIISWPRYGTKLSVQIVVGDGPGQSFADEQEILRLCHPFSNQDPTRAVSIERTEHRHLADRTSVRLWSEDWSTNAGCPPEPDTVVSFGGAYMPCMWYESAILAIQACGGPPIRLLVLALKPDDYRTPDIPWEVLFSHLPGLGVLYPWKRVMESIGPVADEHALGSNFRATVQDFESI